MSDETLKILLPAINALAVSVMLPLCIAGLGILQWWLSKKAEIAAKNAEWAAQKAETAADNAKVQAKVAASKVEEVKDELKTTSDRADEKSDATFEVVKDIHTLTNSAMGLTLASNAALARWKADQTKGQPEWKENEAAAAKAEAALKDHQAKQAEVDSRKEVATP